MPGRRRKASLQAVSLILVQVVQEEITVVGGGGGQDLDSNVVSTDVCGSGNHVSLVVLTAG